MNQNKQNIINAGNRLITNLESIKKQIQKNRKNAFIEAHSDVFDAVDDFGDDLFSMVLGIISLGIHFAVLPKLISASKTDTKMKQVKEECRNYTNFLLSFPPQICNQFKCNYLPLFFTNRYFEGHKDVGSMTTKEIKALYTQEIELIEKVIEELKWNISVVDKNCR